MTLHQFQIFIAISKHKNLTRASAELRISQPGVSQQMRILQEEYGVKLYKRTVKGVELTNAGRRFLSAVSPILEQVGKLRNTAIQSAPSPAPDLLAVGGTYSSSTILLPSLLSRFKKLHPRTDINFRTNSGSEIERLLLKQIIEIALTTSLPKSPRIMAEPFRREKLVLVVSRIHPLARARNVSLRALEQTPFLVRSSGEPDGATVTHLKSFAENKGIKVTIGMRFEAPSALNEAVQRNMGIGILYEDVAKYNLKRGEFKALKVQGLKLEGQSYITYLNDKPLAKAATEFLMLLRRSQKNKRITRNSPSAKTQKRLLRPNTFNSKPSSFERMQQGTRLNGSVIHR
jgi:LysR family transcriptional regulator, low CO2-responsive transcriptional regulator